MAPEASSQLWGPSTLWALVPSNPVTRHNFWPRPWPHASQVVMRVRRDAEGALFMQTWMGMNGLAVNVCPSIRKHDEGFWVIVYGQFLEFLLSTVQNCVPKEEEKESVRIWQAFFKCVPKRALPSFLDAYSAHFWELGEVGWARAGTSARGKSIWTAPFSWSPRGKDRSRVI